MLVPNGIYRYNAKSTVRKAVRIFYVLGFAFWKEGGDIRLKGVIPTMSYDSMMVMLTFGLLIVTLIGLIVVIIKNMKK